jgi:Zn-dependent membrane protease YugP
MYFDWTMILLLPGLLLGLWAQSRVSSAYKKYAKVFTQRGLPAEAVVRDLLTRQGAGSIAIAPIAGELTDHFDPRTDTLSLSSGVYGSSSVAAVGIAAHEAGHALQKMQSYPFLTLRTAAVPVVNIGSHLAWPIFFAGIIFSWQPLMTAGIALFALVVLFSLITLPVEFDASRRANLMLADSGYFTEEELRGVRAVLNAAALTYVASFLSSLMQLLRLVLLSQRRRR